MAAADRSPHSACMQSQRRSKASAGRQPATGARAERSRRTAGRLLLWRTDRGPASRLDARSTALPSGGCRAVPTTGTDGRDDVQVQCAWLRLRTRFSELKPQRLAVVPGIQAPSQLEPDLEHLHPSTHGQRQRAEILNCRYCILV
jgi:hypothetical protein